VTGGRRFEPEQIRVRQSQTAAVFMDEDERWTVYLEARGAQTGSETTDKAGLAGAKFAGEGEYFTASRGTPGEPAKVLGFRGGISPGFPRTAAFPGNRLPT